MSQGNSKFGTTFNCMDGRAIESSIQWMKEAYGLDHIDSITEPGIDKFIREMDTERRAWLKRKLEISIKHHGSRTVSVVGHDDCAGNPVSKEEHVKHIAEGVKIVKSLVEEIDPSLHVDVVGLWAFPLAQEKEWAVKKVG